MGIFSRFFQRGQDGNPVDPSAGGDDGDSTDPEIEVTQAAHGGDPQPAAPSDEPAPVRGSSLLGAAPAKPPAAAAPAAAAAAAPAPAPPVARPQPPAGRPARRAHSDSVTAAFDQVIESEAGDTAVMAAQSVHGVSTVEDLAEVRRV